MQVKTLYKDIENMNAAEYKKYHESFMENNNGSTMVHTFLSIFFTVQCTMFCAISSRHSEWFQYFYEYVFIVVPMIIAHTMFSDHIYLLNIIIFTILMHEFMQRRNDMDILKTFSMPNHFPTKEIHSISCMRGLTYLITVFCILAVDFQDFPRHLAKTEKNGYSLMDTGVGLFVLMSGLVHKDVRRDNYISVIKGNIKFISILTILGIIRFWSVKQLDYQEHVTEYGVHWNFFFTLAVCKLTSSLLLFFVKNALILSILSISLHEYLLYNGLEQWVVSDVPRTTLLAANREGITSCLGYTSLYLFAAYLHKELNNRTAHRYSIFMKLASGSVILWTLSYCINIYRPTSRTLANAGYCIYLETILVTVMLFMYSFEVLFQESKKQFCFDIPIILLAINKNGLIYFLTANLLTGAINMTMRTLLFSYEMTFITLNIYMIITIALAIFLIKKHIKI